MKYSERIEQQRKNRIRRATWDAAELAAWRDLTSSTFGGFLFIDRKAVNAAALELLRREAVIEDLVRFGRKVLGSWLQW